MVYSILLRAQKRKGQAGPDLHPPGGQRTRENCAPVMGPRTEGSSGRSGFSPGRKALFNQDGEQTGTGKHREKGEMGGHVHIACFIEDDHRHACKQVEEDSAAAKKRKKT